jgi:hypothetical protein
MTNITTARNARWLTLFIAISLPGAVANAIVRVRLHHRPELIYHMCRCGYSLDVLQRFVRRHLSSARRAKDSARTFKTIVGRLSWQFMVTEGKAKGEGTPPERATCAPTYAQAEERAKRGHGHDADSNQGAKTTGEPRTFVLTRAKS